MTCDFGDCARTAMERLYFGDGIDHDTGEPLSCDYCAEHADEVAHLRLGNDILEGLGSRVQPARHREPVAA